MNKIKTIIFFQNYGGAIAMAIAIVAMAGSLYFSEIAGFIPCTLCWYQRILMYPLVLITLVGTLKQDEYLPLYVLPLSMLGIGVSGYHVLLQNNVVSTPGACAIGVPCSASYVNYLGFISIPVMALTAFVLITIVMLVTYWAFSYTVSEETETATENPPIADEPATNQTKITKRQLIAGIGIALLIVLFALIGFRKNTAADSLATLTFNSMGPQLNDTSPSSPGEVLFTQSSLGNAPGCIACHSLEAGTVIVGPSIADITQRTRNQSGQELTDYVRDSIVSPDAHIVDGFTAGVMYQDYKDNLTGEQIDDLVSFILTLQ